MALLRAALYLTDQIKDRNVRRQVFTHALDELLIVSRDTLKEGMN